MERYDVLGNELPLQEVIYSTPQVWQDCLEFSGQRHSKQEFSGYQSTIQTALVGTIPDKP